MGTLVDLTSDHLNRNNRHGNPMTLEQLVNLDQARHGLSRKLNKSGRFRSLCGDDDQLVQYLSDSVAHAKGNGSTSRQDVIYNHLIDSKDYSKEPGNWNNGLKESEVKTTFVNNNNNIVEHGFNDSDSRLLMTSAPRLVTLERMSNGEFDLALQDVAVVQRGTGIASGQERTVAVIESAGHSLPSVFLPGDRVLEINGLQTDGMSSSEIMSQVNKSGNKVRLKVQPIPELNELFARTDLTGELVLVQDQCIQKGTLKRTGSMRFRINKEKLTVEPESGLRERMSGMMVWLSHKRGFTLAEVIGSSSKDPTKCLIRLQNSNTQLQVSPSEIEKANPPFCDRLEDLSSLPYLNESSFLNTLKQRFTASLTHTYVGQTLIVFNPMRSLSVYSDKVIALFEGCHMEDMPPHIYATAQSAYRNMMDTGQHQSLVLIGHSGSGKTMNLKQILYYFTVIAAKSTDKNITATKVNAAFVLLEAFGNCRTIQNASATRFLQTTSVNFDRGGNMTGISIQTMLLERTRILRRPEGEPTFHIFYQMLNGLEENLRRELFLENLTDSNLFLTPLKMPSIQQKSPLTWNKICQAMSVLNFSQSEIRAICSIVAAIYHLGVAGSLKGSGGRHHQFARPPAARRAANILGSTLVELSDLVFSHQHSYSSAESASRIDLLEDYVVCLYSELFKTVVDIINRSLKSDRKDDYCIMLFDSSGFQNPASCGRVSGSSFQDLCSNYLQERLQALFKETLITSRLDLYRKEDIQCDLTNVTSVLTSPTIGIIDGKTKTINRPGLFSLLDEVRSNSSSSDEMFRQTFLNHCNSINKHGDDQVVTGGDCHLLLMNHMLGSLPVVYDVQGWIRITKQTDLYRQMILKSLSQSSRQEIKSIIGSNNSRKESSPNQSFCQNIVATIDKVIGKLKSGHLRFILCLSPLPSAGLCDVALNKLLPLRSLSSDDAEELSFDEQFVRSQIHGYELPNVARLYRQAFPENMTFEEFSKRFGILVPPESRIDTDDPRESVQHILDYMKVDRENYQLGHTQVFLRPIALSLLNDEKEEVITAWVEKLQTICRGWLGRKHLEKLRQQTSCIQCIQNNVRIMSSVKDWPWWKLFSRVRPLVQANIMEQEKKFKAIEMEELKKKLEKIEKEKNELKEAVNLMGTTKSRRRGTLDDEDIFNDVTDSPYPRSSNRRYSNFDSEGEDDDDSYNQFYRGKYEDARRQGDLEKKKIQREHEDSIEDLISSKNLVEKKLQHAHEDIEEQKSLLESATKKSQQYSKDLTELKSNFLDQKSLNEELEAKQKRSDAEIRRLSELLKTERLSREKMLEEKSKIEDEKRSTEMKLMDAFGEIEIAADKTKNLQQELEFLSTSKKDDKELLKIKADFERKCQKQEEELVSREAAIKQLEMDKLQLESVHDKLKSQQTRIQREKEEELEEQRKLLQKKIKEMVLQLEDETAEKTKLQQQKIEIERRLLLKSEPDRNKEKKLRRKVKQMKILLKDTNLLSNSASIKALRQIKIELEDARQAAASALKSRKVAELEITEIQAQMEILRRSKTEADDRFRRVTAEHADLASKLDSAGDDYEELLKKYRALVQQNSLELTRLQDQSNLIEELMNQLEKKREESETLQSRLQFQQNASVSKQVVLRLEKKISELESIVEMESTGKGKIEKNLSRLKAQLDDESTARKQMEAERADTLASNKQLEKQIRDLKEQLRVAQKKESEITLRNQHLEKQMQNYELECEKYNEELQFSNKRLTELQKVLATDQFGVDSDEQLDLTEESEDESDDLASLPIFSRNSLLLSPKRSLEEHSEA